MKIPDKNTLIDRLNSIRSKKAVAAMLVVICLFSIPVAAVSINISDDFEDQSTEGWEGQGISISTDSASGQYSLTQSDGFGSQSEKATWLNGPRLDLTQEFNIQGQVKSNLAGSGLRTRIGVIEPGTPPSGVILTFSDGNGVTYLSTSGLEDPSDPDIETINTDFDNTWVNFDIQSEGDGTVRAKVWEVGTPEPTEYQIERTFTATSGPIAMTPGIDSSGREMWLDNVSVEGTRAPSNPLLTLDVNNYMEPGSTQEYRVINETVIEGKDLSETKDVTENATVESLNTSVITVDSNTNELVATSDRNVGQRVTIQATYGDRIAYKEVAVATRTVDNLDVLPSWARFSAILLDRTLQMIIAGSLIGVVATRFSSSFGGIAAYQMSITAGWFIGWVNIGIALLSLFVCLFVGLNLAANIDYTVRR